jgi:segregation and condensation protein B
MRENDEAMMPGSHWQLEIEAPFRMDAAAETMPRPAATKGRSTSDSPPPLLRLIEAMLFIGGSPLTPAKVNEIIRGLSDDQMAESIGALNLAYRRQGRPYLIEQRDHGYVLALRPTYRFVHEKLRGGVREARLSLAAIEVLSVVAYRQPVTKQEIDTLRGHESGGQLRQLIRRGLLAILDRATTRGTTCYATTNRFLELFGLSGLEDLPRTEDLQRL